VTIRLESSSGVLAGHIQVSWSAFFAKMFGLFKVLTDSTANCQLLHFLQRNSPEIHCWNF